MELRDTIKLMTSADYKERFKAEYFQLTIRMHKLQTLLNNYASGRLDFKPKVSYGRLSEQYSSMEKYQQELKLRAQIEEIDLEESETPDSEDQFDLSLIEDE